MKINYIIQSMVLAGLGLFLLLFACGESDYSTSDERNIESHEEVIVFFGDTESDVTFNHKDHSDRYNGDCFECHSCGDFSETTYWRCQECHTSDDPEHLCEGESDGHGCVMVQCETCHERNYEYKDCVDCHP
jgi:hypothetical protein